jgi:uncharacterized protein
LIPDDCEELEHLKKLHNALKAQKQQTLGLTIVPTLDCNFRCTYCFSYARHEKISTNVEDAIIHFIEDKLPENGNLSIVWYGGEPTLCLDIIENLTTRMRSVCESHSAQYLPADIITNGFLLTRSTAQRLTQNGITTAQVTLDGDQVTHDRRRPLKDLSGTFEHILDNITQARDILDIQIRINIDRNNFDTAVAALDSIVGHGLKGMPVYFGQVKQYTEACADIASSCLSDLEFSQTNLSLSRQAVARGFTSLHYPQLQLGGVCGAEYSLGYLIAPDGLLFKCWAQASLGPEYSIGDIFGNKVTPTQQNNLRQFMDFDPLHDERCRECRVLPICMGGCPYLRQNNSPDANCSIWRHSLLDTLALRYKMEQLFKEVRK